MHHVVTVKSDHTMQKTVPVCSVSSPEAGLKQNISGFTCDEKNLHDFRSSLSIIIGYSEMMIDGVLGQMTEEQLDGIKDVLATSRRMQDVIDVVSRRKTPVLR
jgi:hypothetical protein